MKHVRRIMWKSALFAAMALGAMGSFYVSGQAEASVVAALSDEQLVALSEVIVQGRIVSSEGEMLSDGRVVTRHTVEVMRWFKAPDGVERGERFSFYTHGGVYGDLMMRVSGEASLDVGDEIVVYLEPLGRGTDKKFYPLGLSQGAYAVIADSAGERRVVRSDERLMRRLIRSKARSASMTDESRSDDVLLEQYVEGLERLVREGISEREALEQLPFRRDDV